MSDFDSTAGSGLQCAALFCFLFFLLQFVGSNPDSVNVDTLTLQFIDDIQESIGQVEKHHVVKIRLGIHRWEQ